MKECNCKLTDLLDKFLMGRTSVYCTSVILDEKYSVSVEGLTAHPIRVPGATRGSVFVDEAGFIQKVEFDPEVAFVGYGPLGCFSPSVQQAVQSLYGTALVSSPC